MRATLTLLAALAVAPRAEAAEPFDTAVSGAHVVFVGKPVKARLTATVVTDPPVHYFDLTFDAGTALRGRVPEKAVFVYSVCQRKRPEFPSDQAYLVAATRSEGRFVVTLLEAEDPVRVGRAKALAELPVGWLLDKGNPVSPWAAWPKLAAKPAGPVCAKSGRPALFAGANVELSAEQIVPLAAHPSVNPFGDGLFRITVTNRGTEDVEVPALLSAADGTIDWGNSLVVIHREAAQPLSGFAPKALPKATRLKAGASVSTTIDVLTLPNLRQPGGDRLYFEFALGDRVASGFFYYFHDFHGPMRARALKGQQN